MDNALFGRAEELGLIAAGLGAHELFSCGCWIQCSEVVVIFELPFFSSFRLQWFLIRLKSFDDSRLILAITVSFLLHPLGKWTEKYVGDIDIYNL